MTRWFKSAVLNMPGYISPPQQNFRIKLNQNESPFDVPAEIKKELAGKAEKASWNRYPVNESPMLAQKLGERHGLGPQNILLGNGSNQLFQTLLTAALEPNDAVVYTIPTFSLYELYTHVYGGKIIALPAPPGEPYPLDRVLKAVRGHSPKLVYLCSPNNPTGQEIELSAVREICSKTDGLVLFDEAYAEFTDQTAVDLLPACPNLIVSRTFSKAFSFAGLRFGYFIAGAEIIEQLRKVNLPYNINIFTETAAIRLLDSEKELMRRLELIRQERERLYRALRRCEKLTVYPSKANFILLRAPEKMNLFLALKERGVLVRDVSDYPLLEGCVRVTVGLQEENDLFLSVLKEILKN